MTQQHEQTAAPAPRRRRPRALIALVTVQSIWLIAASAGRVLAVAGGNGHLDALPFVSFALGVVGILVVTMWTHHR